MTRQDVTCQEAAICAVRTERAVGRYLSALRNVEIDSYFDALALSVLLKEQVSFGDIRLLADHGRFDGAQARLRSIWESLMILHYATGCAASLEDASNAFFLQDEYKRANILRTNGGWDVLTDAEQQLFDEFSDEYRALPEQLRQFVKANTQQVHKAVLDRDATLVPSLDFRGASITQYDAAFRVFSAKVHGGLSGTHSHADEWLNNAPTDDSRRRFDYVGILLTASSWLRDIVSAWVANSTNAKLMVLWQVSGDLPDAESATE